MKYAIISNKGSHDYDIQVIETENSKTYSMYYSKSEIWTTPGEHLQTVTDDGNDMHFNPKLKKTLDYAKFCEVSMLLDFIKNYDKTLSEEFEIYKKIK